MQKLDCLSFAVKMLPVARAVDQVDFEVSETVLHVGRGGPERNRYASRDGAAPVLERSPLAVRLPAVPEVRPEPGDALDVAVNRGDAGGRLPLQAPAARNLFGREVFPDHGHRFRPDSVAVPVMDVGLALQPFRPPVGPVRVVLFPAPVALQFPGKPARGDSRLACDGFLRMPGIQQGFNLVS